MTNYITAVGAQQFSITIASGSTTGTATIAAVGSGAFIVYGGQKTSVTADTAEAFAYLTLTNSTTITATRNTGTAGAVTITGTIIDADTSNLIKSVQFGTIAIAGAGSGTATISAVTNANAAVLFLGFASTAISASFLNEYPCVSLSGTTVTGNTGVSTSGTTTLGFAVVEFQGSALTANGVQQISATSSSSVTSFTAAVTSVTVANTLSFYGGATNASVATSFDQTHLRGTLTNATTFTVSVNSASSSAKVYNVCIAEFNSGVLNSAAQYGSTTLTGATSNTSALSPSVTVSQSGLSYLGNSYSAANSNWDRSMGSAVLTNTSTVTVSKNTSTATITGSWEVFEFPAFSGGTVLGAAWNPYYTMFGACSGSGYNV